MNPYQRIKKVWESISRKFASIGYADWNSYLMIDMYKFTKRSDRIVFLWQTYNYSVGLCYVTFLADWLTDKSLQAGLRPY